MDALPPNINRFINAFLAHPPLTEAKFKRELELQGIPVTLDTIVSYVMGWIRGRIIGLHPQLSEEQETELNALMKERLDELRQVFISGFSQSEQR